MNRKERINKLLEIINNYKDYSYLELEVKIRMNEGSYGYGGGYDKKMLEEEYKDYDECVERFENDLKESKLGYDKEMDDSGYIFEI